MEILVAVLPLLPLRTCRGAGKMEEREDVKSASEGDVGDRCSVNVGVIGACKYQLSVCKYAYI